MLAFVADFPGGTVCNDDDPTSGEQRNCSSVPWGLRAHTRHQMRKILSCSSSSPCFSFCDFVSTAMSETVECVSSPSCNFQWLECFNAHKLE